MHVWYRIPQELRSLVIQAAQELAIIAGENPDDTLPATLNLTHGARSAGQALSELSEANRLKAQKRREARTDKEAKRLRERLHSEQGHAF